MSKMLITDDLDLTSIQFCSDSLKEKLKQTMLNQEFVFMRQVSELHRSYKTQVAMTEDSNFKQQDLDNFNLHVGGINSIPVNSNHQIKSSKDDSWKSEKLNLHHGARRSTSGFLQKPLDLQLPADEFIRQSAHAIFGEGVLVNTFKESIGPNNSSINKFAPNLDNLNLSLSMGLGTHEKCGEHRSWMGKRTCPSSSVIIDLDDPYSGFSGSAGNLGHSSGFAATKTCSKEKRKLETFLNSDRHNLVNISISGIKHISSGTALSGSVRDADPSCQRQTLCGSGSSELCRELPSADHLSNYKASPPYAENKLDLNKAQLEDISYVSSNHSVVVNPHKTKLSVLSEKVYSKSVISSISPSSRQESNVNDCKEVSKIHVQNVVETNSACHFMGNVGEMYRKVGNSGQSSRGKITYIDLDSDSSEELCSRGSCLKLESVGSCSKLSDGMPFKNDMVGPTGAEADLEKGLKPLVLSQSKRNPIVSSSSSESECMINHQSSSIKTMQSFVKGGGSNFSISDKSDMLSKSLAADPLGELDLRSSGCPESNMVCMNRKEPEFDGGVQEAAELLVKLSLDPGSSSQCDTAKSNLKEVRNKEFDQPQCCYDSYETMVLNAKESNPDDYSISSNAFVVDESEEKDCKYKLKRGTRMKDFQKDILPGLSTLSRHEIREDMRIIEGIIRSREYKKIRGKKADEGDWCRSIRSKRSRLSRR